MEELIKACQRLFNHPPLPVWDQLYMLKVISYRDLQKEYKNRARRMGVEGGQG
jgi:hypothetical protein